MPIKEYLSSINLTDKLYGLFKTDKCASELRKFDCPSDDEIWHYLGFYKEGVVTLCEKNIQSESKKLSESIRLNMTQTHIYWAIEELVRLHEHAHHLFFNLRWRNYQSDGAWPFKSQAKTMLAKLGKQRGITPNLEVHERFEGSKGLRSILDLPTPLQNKYYNDIYDKSTIESLAQFAVYYMIRRNERLRMVFNQLDEISPKEYRYWNDISNSCKGYRVYGKITVVPYVFNVVTSVLSSIGLNPGVVPTNITIDDVLNSLKHLSERS